MNLILGTAGHIDHGKSSLVRALTGVDPDRLPEEKARGVTIELGFAHLKVPHPIKNKPDFEIGVIDVPGHADFINNMVAGVGALDLAVFVVAADDAWMPQSEEHLHVLSYLGVKNAVIALTKSDICEDIDFTIEVLREELEGSLLSEAPIIPVSSITGVGLDDLRAELGRQFQQIAAARSTAANRLPRLSIDRAFSPQGIGTVVTGTLTGGTVKIGDSLRLEPEGLDCSIRQIQNHSSQVDHANPGMRTALNVPDLALASRSKSGAHRGSDLIAPGTGSATEIIDVQLSRINREVPGQPLTRQPIKLPRKIIVHLGTGYHSARLVSRDQIEVNPGDTFFAQLRFDAPVHCLVGDSLVIRDASKLATLGGGVVLEPDADRRRFHSESQLDFLTARAAAPHNIDTLLTSALQRDKSLPAARPVDHCPFTNEAIAKSIAKLKKSGKLTTIADFIVDNEWWKGIYEKSSKRINQWHIDQPDLPGLPIDSLQDLTESTQLLVSGLASRGFEKRGDSVASVDHLLTLPPQLQSCADQILAQLNAEPLQALSRTDLSSSENQQKAYTYLLRQNELIELDPKVIISAAAYERTKNRVRDFITSQGPATASQIRQHLDTSRKVLMPLLEKLDGDKVTLRDGDLRSLR